MQRFILIIVATTLGQYAWSFDAEMGIENRYFFEEGTGGQEKYQHSVRGELSYEFESDDGSQIAETVLFGRYDFEDNKRTHVDIREFAWTYVGDEWEVKAGISKVFWGVTESAHLVDIINQTDLVESLDGEDKLGQPMIKTSFEKSWGTLDFFLLPYFRERTFPGPDGRLQAPFEIDQNDAQYESSADRFRGDVAVRYSHYIGELEFGISHFSGTSREPELVLTGLPASPVLIPTYHTIDQTGLDLQYIWEEWLFKLEAISNAGFDDRYSAAVGGFEMTQVGVFDTIYDLGWLLEYHFDDRKEEATTTFEQDIFFGWRLAFNDADSSELLAGVIVDPETEETVYSVEVTKRLTQDVKLNIEAAVFDGAEDLPSNLLDKLSMLDDANARTAPFQNEDYVQLELVHYF